MMIKKTSHIWPSYFEFFGVDVIMDNNYDLYLMEVNSSPMIIGTNEKKTELF